MTTVLPDVTNPPTVRVDRLHAPGGAYARFRSCLRVEFGYSCALCLLHESDIAHDGAEGWAVTTVEHFVPQSRSPSQRDDYENCLYACRRCNRPHGDAAPIARRQLLDPTTTEWANHFRAVDDRLEPIDGDHDARYTEAMYRLNDTSKLRARRRRRMTLSRARAFLERALAQLEVLQRVRADTRAGRNDDPDELVMLLRDAVIAARADLLRASAVPADATETCACSVSGYPPLPAWLAAQCTEVLGEDAA